MRSLCVAQCQSWLNTGGVGGVLEGSLSPAPGAQPGLASHGLLGSVCQVSAVRWARDDQRDAGHRWRWAASSNSSALGPTFTSFEFWFPRLLVGGPCPAPTCGARPPYACINYVARVDRSRLPERAHKHADTGWKGMNRGAPFGGQFGGPALGRVLRVETHLVASAWMCMSRSSIHSTDQKHQ